MLLRNIFKLTWLTSAFLACIITATLLLVVSISPTVFALPLDPTQDSQPTAQIETEKDESKTGVMSTDEEPAEDPAINCAKNPDDCDLYVKYINPIIKYLTAFVGIAVTIGIVTGGIRYAAAGSDPGAVAKARKTITNSIIALVAYILLYALISWLKPGGL